MSNEDRMKIIKEYKTRYWLQAFGCEERLFGSKPLIQSRVRIFTKHISFTFSISFLLKVDRNEHYIATI